jgi:hypothetical protein
MALQFETSFTCQTWLVDISMLCKLHGYRDCAPITLALAVAIPFSKLYKPWRRSLVGRSLLCRLGAERVM